MKTVIALAAALTLASASAHAQGGPPDVQAPSIGGGGGGGGPPLGGGGGGADSGPPFGGGGGGRGAERAQPDRGPIAEPSERVEPSQMKASDAVRNRGEDAAPTERRERAAERRERDKGDSAAPDKAVKRQLSKDDDSDRAESRASKEPKADKSAKDDVGKATRAVEEKRDEATRRSADEEAKSAKAADEKSGRRADPGKAKEVQLSADRRDHVRDEFRKVSDVKRRTDVDVRISVGRRLPRHWHFYPVPIAVIEIVPEYRDYVFVYIDDEYVICDPDTYEVVAIIDAPVTTAGGGGACSTDLRLSDKTEGIILGSVRSEDEVDARGLEVGWRVPDDIDLHEFDETVTSSEPDLEFCRYFVSEHQVAIVDPKRDRVVLLVEEDR